MKLTTLLLNIIGLVIALLWLVKSNYDLEPIITIIGFIGAFISVFNIGKGENTSVGKPKYRKRKNSFSLFLIGLIFTIGLLLFSLYRLNTTSIIGIKGNNNNNNQIQIK